MRFCMLPLLAVTLAAQTPQFEVASIRPANSLVTPAFLCGSPSMSPERELSLESTLASAVLRLDILINEAYLNVVDDFDLPDWIRNSGAIAVSVKIPPKTSAATCRQMLRNLLAERFHLVTGVETRDVNRYFVKVAKSGLKLKQADKPSTDPNTSYTSNVENGRAKYTFHAAPMSRILNTISTAASRYASAFEIRMAIVDPVVDETGLTGYYNGEFDYITSIASLRNGPAESIEDSVSRQLGLTLELRRAPGKILVIRSSDRTPTEN